MLVLAGTIGAGKSSLAELVGEHYGTDVFYESVDDNPVLDLYYKDPKKYAFLLQIYFLNKRFESIKKAYIQDNNVLDRSIFEDALFLDLNVDNGNVTKTEQKIYHELLDNMMEELEGMPKKAPDLLIYIDVSFDKMLERIKMRGRSFEQIDYDPGLYNYYKQVHDAYPDWYANYHTSPKLRIDGNKYDFVNDKAAAEHVLKQIDEALTTIR
ncbi:deoxynucleoside kinase [Bifidobacterium dolichotidis]|uniref:Deoxynucleoside kinase n=1 Tax=Bifidobacterium dolichotidis TaxID=2306976 RepID=A0A430FTG4_9BIFI|nr:deoxynucleoside kinase [Bifidobacterium dolichotidis]RSX56115.1 deoxynucleoside kinase [Bifidobacterium dolichotidis]